MVFGCGVRLALLSLFGKVWVIIISFGLNFEIVASDILPEVIGDL